MKFVATKEGMTPNFFSSLSFVLVFGSGMGKNQDPGSGINIPDPQHCFFPSCPPQTTCTEPVSSLPTELVLITSGVFLASIFLQDSIKGPFNLLRNVIYRTCHLSVLSSVADP
jgi:hypothetical protein